MKVARYSFKGQYLQRSSLNDVAISKHLEKLPPQLSKQRNDAITGNFSHKIIHGSFLLQYGRLDVLQVKAE